MKKVYIVMYSEGSYEDYREHIHKVFKNENDAEKEAELVRKELGTEPEFPYKNKEETIDNYYTGRLTNGQDNKVDKWVDKNNRYQDFNDTWVEGYKIY